MFDRKLNKTKLYFFTFFAMHCALLQHHRLKVGLEISLKWNLLKGILSDIAGILSLHGGKSIFACLPTFIYTDSSKSSD